MSNPQSETPSPKYLTLIPIFEELCGERLIVRPYRLEDAEGLREAVEESREHIRPWLPFADAHQTLEESRDWINQQRANAILRKTINCGLFAIGSGRFLGGLGIMPRDWEIRYFEIGYWLRKSATGRGYMREAVAVMTRLAFDTLGANRVMIRCDARNERSRRVAEGCGFVFEGCHRRDSLAVDGTLRDTRFFSLIREEYEARTSTEY